MGELHKATECFITSATREVMPVASLRMPDGRLLEFPEGGGDLTRLVRGYYAQHVEAYLHEHAHLNMF